MLDKNTIMSTLLDMARDVSRVATIVEDIKHEEIPEMKASIKSIDDTVTRIDSKHNKDIITITAQREKDIARLKQHEDTFLEYKADLDKRMNILWKERQMTVEEKVERRKQIFTKFLEISTKVIYAILGVGLSLLTGYFLGKDIFLIIINSFLK